MQSIAFLTLLGSHATLVHLYYSRQGFGRCLKAVAEPWQLCLETGTPVRTRSCFAGLIHARGL